MVAQDLRRINVVLFEKDAEPVLLRLGEMGVAHYIDMHDEIDSFDSLMEQYVVPEEYLSRLSDLLSRIDCVLRGLDVVSDQIPSEETLPHEHTIEDLLIDIENGMSQIESESEAFVEIISLSSNILRKLDQIINSRRISSKNKHFRRRSLSSSNLGETLLEAQQSAIDIERAFKETEDVSKSCSSVLSKVSLLTKNLGTSRLSVHVGEVPFPPQNRFFEIIEKALFIADSELRSNKKVSSATAKELITIEATILKVVDQIPEKKANLENQTLQLRDYVSRIRRLTKSRPEFKSLLSSLSSLRVAVVQIETLIKAENNMGKIASTFIFRAWVPATSLNQVMDEIKKITHGKCLIIEEPPESDEIVPTIIKPVPRFFEGFEKISFSLGNPVPGETNPIWFTAITFPLLFGFMFADVGQGAILLALGVVLAYFRGRVDIDKISDIKRFLLMGSGVLVFCGLSAIFFGFLFGDFFGPSGVIPPILLDPMHEPARLLRFAIGIGVIMLSSSLALRIYNNVKNKLSNPAFISVCWLWLLLGGFFMWIYWGGISNVTMWFGEGLIMFSFLIIFPVVLMLAVTALTKSVMEGLELSIETFIETLSHTISFSRLAALCLVHTALNQLFLLLAGGSGHAYPTISWQSIPLIMVGTVLAITIEGLIIFTHCLRLHWVEMLPKFFSGKGIPFKPLSLNGSNLIEDKNNGP